MYEILANAVVVLHALVVLVIVFALILVRIREMIGWLYHIVISTVLSTFISQIIWPACPLTTLENYLRAKHDPSTTFDDSYLSHYMNKWFGAEFLPHIISTQIILLFLVVTLASIILHRLYVKETSNT